MPQHEPTQELLDTLNVERYEDFKASFKSWFTKEFAIRRGEGKYAGIESPETILNKLKLEIDLVTKSIWEARDSVSNRAELFKDTRPWWKRFVQALFRLDRSIGHDFQTLLKKAATLQSKAANVRINRSAPLSQALREGQKRFEKYTESTADHLERRANYLEKPKGGFLGFGKKPVNQEDIDSARRLRLGAQKLRDGEISYKNQRRLERRMAGNRLGYAPTEEGEIAKEHLSLLKDSAKATQDAFRYATREQNARAERDKARLELKRAEEKLALEERTHTRTREELLIKRAETEKLVSEQRLKQPKESREDFKDRMKKDKEKIAQKYTRKYPPSGSAIDLD